MEYDSRGRINQMTLKDAKRAIPSTMTLRKRNGEYRVTYRYISVPRAEELAYYTTDLQDAMDTATRMQEICVCDSCLWLGVTRD